MIPVLRECLDNGFFVSSDGLVGVSAHVRAIDSESSQANGETQQLRTWLKTLDPRLIVRFIQESRPTKAPAGFARSPDIPDGVSKSSILSICYQGEEFIGDIKTMLGLKRESQATQLEFIKAALDSFPRPFETLKHNEIQRSFFLKPLKFKVGSSFVDLGSQLVGALRLEKQTSHPIYQDTLERSLMGLEMPFDVVTSLRRLSRTKREAVLRTRFRQDRSANDRVSDIRAEASGLALEETAMNGAELYQFELLIRVYASSEAQLRDSLRTIKERMSPMGDMTIETFGCLPSLVATMPGSPMHVPLLEMDGALAAFIPARGSASDQNREPFTSASDQNREPFVPASSQSCESFPRDGSRLCSLALGCSEMTRSSSQLLAVRKDSTFFSIDLLSPNVLNSNGIIVGSSGRGKSVLTGLLTQSLLNDPNVKVIKVDVGGSHSKECELLGGTEYRMSLTQPSGICVFTQASALSATAPELSRSVLSKYVEVLVFEEGESVLPKTVRIEIDEFVKGYLESNPSHPSVDGFYEFAQGFSRERLLSRWVSGGMYAPASALRAASAASHKLRATTVTSHSLNAVEVGQTARDFDRSRLIYFNFSQIFEAADKDFAQAGMAAVLAQFNLEIASTQLRATRVASHHQEIPSTQMRAAKAASHDEEMARSSGCSQSPTRVILICDETPFFIERCFEFFKFSMANVRKFGAGLIPVVQQSSDLIQNGDTSLIDNAHHRFIFSNDGDAKEFANRFKLSEEQAAKIAQLQSIPKVKSEFLYQAGDEVKTVSLKLSSKEYWELTSTLADRSRLDALRENVPGLTLSEAISALTVGRRG